MKDYKPEALVAVSRYQNFFPTLDQQIRTDVYARMQKLIEEEKEYCDKGNYSHMAQILTSIALYEVLQKHGKTRKLLIAGIIGCLLYVVGDFLFAATGKGQTTETIGLFTKIAYLDMAEWRMWASILCGFIGTILYYMGFHRMYGLLKGHVTEPKNRIWVRLFRAAYIMGTVAWAWVHAMFMTNALIFKFVFEAYGEVQTAADIANRVFYANAPGMLTAYIVCDFGLTIIMITMVWKKIIPLKSTGARILATFCNPIMFPGVVGNLVALLPWPINQLDHGTESFGHALVLMLGLILLKEMVKAGEIAQ